MAVIIFVVFAAFMAARGRVRCAIDEKFSIKKPFEKVYAFSGDSVILNLKQHLELEYEESFKHPRIDANPPNEMVKEELGGVGNEIVEAELLKAYFAANKISKCMFTLEGYTLQNRVVYLCKDQEQNILTLHFELQLLGSDSTLPLIKDIGHVIIASKSEYLLECFEFKYVDNFANALCKDKEKKKLVVYAFKDKGTDIKKWVSEYKVGDMLEEAIRFDIQLLRETTAGQEYSFIYYAVYARVNTDTNALFDKNHYFIILRLSTAATQSPPTEFEFLKIFTFKEIPYLNTQVNAANQLIYKSALVRNIAIFSSSSILISFAVYESSQQTWDSSKEAHVVLVQGNDMRFSSLVADRCALYASIKLNNTSLTSFQNFGVMIDDRYLKIVTNNAVFNINQMCSMETQPDSESRKRCNYLESNFTYYDNKQIAKLKVLSSIINVNEYEITEMKYMTQSNCISPAMFSDREISCHNNRNSFHNSLICLIQKLNRDESTEQIARFYPVNSRSYSMPKKMTTIPNVRCLVAKDTSKIYDYYGNSLDKTTFSINPAKNENLIKISKKKDSQIEELKSMIDIFAGDLRITSIPFEMRKKDYKGITAPETIEKIQSLQNSWIQLPLSRNNIYGFNPTFSITGASESKIFYNNEIKIKIVFSDGSKTWDSVFPLEPEYLLVSSNIDDPQKIGKLSLFKCIIDISLTQKNTPYQCSETSFSIELQADEIFIDGKVINSFAILVIQQAKTRRYIAIDLNDTKYTSTQLKIDNFLNISNPFVANDMDERLRAGNPVLMSFKITSPSNNVPTSQGLLSTLKQSSNPTVTSIEKIIVDKRSGDGKPINATQFMTHVDTPLGGMREIMNVVYPQINGKFIGISWDNTEERNNALKMNMIQKHQESKCKIHSFRQADGYSNNKVNVQNCRSAICATDSIAVIANLSNAQVMGYSNIFKEPIDGSEIQDPIEKNGGFSFSLESHGFKSLLTSHCRPSEGYVLYIAVNNSGERFLVVIDMNSAYNTDKRIHSIIKISSQASKIHTSLSKDKSTIIVTLSTKENMSSGGEASIYLIAVNGPRIFVKAGDKIGAIEISLKVESGSVSKTTKIPFDISLASMLPKIEILSDPSAPEMKKGVPYNIERFFKIEGPIFDIIPAQKIDPTKANITSRRVPLNSNPFMDTEGTINQLETSGEWVMGVRNDRKRFYLFRDDKNPAKDMVNRISYPSTQQEQLSDHKTFIKVATFAKGTNSSSMMAFIAFEHSLTKAKHYKLLYCNGAVNASIEIYDLQLSVEPGDLVRLIYLFKHSVMISFVKDKTLYQGEGEFDSNTKSYVFARFHEEVHEETIDQIFLSPITNIPDVIPSVNEMETFSSNPNFDSMGAIGALQILSLKKAKTLRIIYAMKRKAGAVMVQGNFNPLGELGNPEILQFECTFKNINQRNLTIIDDTILCVIDTLGSYIYTVEYKPKKGQIMADGWNVLFDSLNITGKFIKPLGMEAVKIELSKNLFGVMLKQLSQEETVLKTSSALNLITLSKSPFEGLTQVSDDISKCDYILMIYSLHSNGQHPWTGLSCEDFGRKKGDLAPDFTIDDIEGNKLFISSQQASVSALMGSEQRQLLKEFRIGNTTVNLTDAEFDIRSVKFNFIGLQGGITQAPSASLPQTMKVEGQAVHNATEQPTSSSWLLWTGVIAGCIILMILIAALVYYFLSKKDDSSYSNVSHKSGGKSSFKREEDDEMML